MLKKIPSDKMNGTKNVIFFLSQAPAHHSFTFNLRLLCKLKHKILKLVVGFSIFDSVSYFLFDKMHY